MNVHIHIHIFMGCRPQKCACGMWGRCVAVADKYLDANHMVTWCMLLMPISSPAAANQVAPSWSRRLRRIRCLVRLAQQSERRSWSRRLRAAMMLSKQQGINAGKKHF